MTFNLLMGVVTDGSSGTHAGLSAGLALCDEGDARVMSFTVLAPIEEARATTEQLVVDTLALLTSERRLSKHAIAVEGSQRGESYGLLTDTMVDPLRLLARSEGLLLDPVYSGESFAGFLDQARSGTWQNLDILFVMTGGTPGLFAYRETLIRP